MSTKRRSSLSSTFAESSTPELANKIWFVTTDHFLTELQRLESGRYPLPISYTPRTWFQYLDILDVGARGSANFARLQPPMRFGVVTGELGIEAIRALLTEQKDLIEKGTVSLKELPCSKGIARQSPD